MIKKGEQIKEQEKTVDPVVTALKKKYGIIHMISVENSDKTTEKCYLKNPDIETFGKALSMVTNKKTDEINEGLVGEVLIRRCWIGGSDKFLEDGPYLQNGSLQAFNLLDIRKSDYEKK